MKSIKLVVIASADIIEASYRNLSLCEDGYAASLPLGIIYLEPGKTYNCTVINDTYIELLDSINAVFLSMDDLRKHLIKDIVLC